MKIQQIYYVMEIARVGSMNQAAKNLYISQPHLSATVADLEKSLKITIFNRSSKGVELTPVGNEFIKVCRNIVDQLDYIESLYSCGGSDETVSITMKSNCHNTVAGQVLLGLSKREQERRTLFSYLTGSSISILSDLAEQKYNLGLLVVPSVEYSMLQGIIRAKRLEFHSLLQENGCVMVGKKNLLFNESSLTVRQCIHCPIVTLHDDWDYAFDTFQIVQFRQHIVVDDKESLFSAVLNNNCVALADPSINCCSYYVDSGNIRLIPLDESEHINYYVGYVCRKNAELSCLEQEFISRYTERIKSIIENKHI